MKYYLFILLVLSALDSQSQEERKDTNQFSTIFYIVNNLEEIEVQFIQDKSTNQLIKKHVGSQEVESKSQRLDRFMIPYIANQLKNNTKNKEVFPYPEEGIGKIKYGYYLVTIAINKFDKFIEYQFFLEKVKNNSQAAELVTSRSFFINPDNENYKSIIITEIQKLFVNHDGINETPIAKIRLDGKLVEGDQPNFRSNIDTIYLDASSSFDDATPKELLMYEWSVKEGDNIAFLTGFNFEQDHQKLLIKDAGVYTFSLRVHDGISWSGENSVTINIQIIDKPRLEIHERNFFNISQNNLWAIVFNSNENINTIKYKLGYDITDFESPGQLISDSCDLIIQYLHSYNRLKKYYSIAKQNQLEDNRYIRQLIVNPILNYRTPKDNCLNYIETAVIYIDSAVYSNPGQILYKLSKKITPGKHQFTVYTKKHSVKSNVDTVNIYYREKNLFSFYAGVHQYKMIERGKYHQGYILGIYKLGLRLYLTQRLSIDPNLLFLFRSRILSVDTNQQVGIVNLSGKINYDVFPIKKETFYTGKPIIYSLTCFASTYQLNLSDPNSNELDGIRQWGIGGEARIQFFANKPQIGNLYLGFEFAYYTNFNKPFWTWTYGLNIHYGLWNY